VFIAYNLSNFKNDSSLSLLENAWMLFDKGNIFDRNSSWLPLFGFWVAGKQTMDVLLLISINMFTICS